MKKMNQSATTRLKTLAAAVAASLAVGANAETRYFDEMLVFGDSLLDGGSYGMRFTNRTGDYETDPYAPVAAQLWAVTLGLEANPAVGGGSNYAIGGLTTPAILTTIVGDESGDGLLGVDPYAATAQPSERTMAFVNGGGNDFLQGLATDSATIQAAAGRVATAAGALSASGVRYIFVSNLPNLGQTPFVQMGDLVIPGSVATSTAGSAGFNQALGIAVSAVPGNVIAIDTAGLFTYALANAGSLGYASGALAGAPVVQEFMCFNDGLGTRAGESTDPTDAACIEHPVYGIDGSAPNPDMLIFNDGVHPTGKAHELWADYLNDIVTAPRIVGMLPQLGINAATQQLQVVGDQFSEQRGGDNTASWFIAGALGSTDIDSAGMPEDQHNSVSIGGFMPLGELTQVGAVVTLGSQETDLAGGSIDGSSVGFAFTLSYRGESLFVESVGSVAISAYDDVERVFNFGSQQLVASGDTDGEALAFDLLAGFDVASGETVLAPAVGIRMINSTVDGYLESGGAVSNYQWADQELDSQQLRLGVIGKMAVGEGLSLQAELFANDESEDGFTQVGVKNTTAGFPSYHLPGIFVEGGSFFTADLGLSMAVGAGKVRLGYSYSDQGEGSNSLRLSYGASF